jgi:RNA polymerase sigma factor (sigma-70 family)
VNNQPGIKLTDQELVRKSLLGDKHAFTMVIKNTEGLVAQIVYKMIDNPEDRKDLAQEIYLRVFRNLQGFRFQSKLSTWVGQIAHNCCLNWLEKKKPLLPDPLPGSDYDPLESLSAKDQDPWKSETENQVFRKQSAGIIKKEIEKLPPLYQTLISLYHQEEMSYEEIGKITSLPEGTLKSYLFRARKLLRENLLSNYKKDEL